MRNLQPPIDLKYTFMVCGWKLLKWATCELHTEYLPVGLNLQESGKSADQMYHSVISLYYVFHKKKKQGSSELQT